jgi:hypothetical protein
MTMLMQRKKCAIVDEEEKRIESAGAVVKGEDWGVRPLSPLWEGPLGDCTAKGQQPVKGS